MLAIVGVVAGGVVPGTGSERDGGRVSSVRPWSDPQPSAAATQDVRVGNALGAPVPQQSAAAVPRAVRDWVVQALPLEGDLVAVDGGASGRVRIGAIASSEVTIALRDVVVAPGHPSVVVLLSQQVRADGPSPGNVDVAGALVELPADDASASIVLSDLSGIPTDVRSVVVADAASGVVLGRAVLLPA
ncbi:hypothetical protein DEU32_101472 [Curtobacterium sp. AG1037]|nr:hypothetical protein DEU32_101472 [Curtobacterium sp. AG1037]